METKTCAFCQTEMSTLSGKCPNCHARQPGYTMHRGHEDKVLAGVCAGLSEQFGIDAVIIRIFFGIAGLVSLGTVFWAYLLLWALMPERPGAISPAAKFTRKLKNAFTSDGGAGYSRV